MHNARASNKGRPLKIGHGRRLVRHIEEKIGKENHLPDPIRRRSIEGRPGIVESGTEAVHWQMDTVVWKGWHGSAGATRHPTG